MMNKNQVVSASDFKAHCLDYLEKTRIGKVAYIVTKRGKPIAKLVPLNEQQATFAFGQMQGSATIIGDIIAPIEVDWGNDAD